MIGRLRVAVPFVLAIPDGAEFTNHPLDYSGLKVVFRRPEASGACPPSDAPGELKIDDKATFLADVLVVDFLKEKFERKEGCPVDPPLEVANVVVNSFLGRLRYLIKAAKIRPIDLSQAAWWLSYLDDEGKELPKEPGLMRGRGEIRASFTLMGVTPAVWDQIFEFPAGFETPEWEVLLLGARGALPETGQAIVLAATALEVFIATILDSLAKKKTISASLWSWINDRGFFLKEPSVEERFDVLLKEFCGTSLKENGHLWIEFKALKTARNEFVHGGAPKIGGRAVSTDRAEQLVASAVAIIDFVRSKLPDDLKWPRLEPKPFKSEALMPLRAVLPKA